MLFFPQHIDLVLSKGHTENTSPKKVHRDKMQGKGNKPLWAKTSPED